jgi:hypothetical protein
VWEGQQIYIKKGTLKGYHGLIKAEGRCSVDVELDAKLMSQGPIMHQVKLGDFDLL